MKIIVVSDNHCRNGVLEEIRAVNSDADMFIHCGDSEMPYDEIDGYIGVRGNNDYDFKYPNELILDLGKYSALVIHGHRYVYFDNRQALVEKARASKCQLVFFGHTHLFEFQKLEEVNLINPGSLHHNRDGSRPCYAIVTIEDDIIDVERVGV